MAGAVLRPLVHPGRLVNPCDLRVVQDPPRAHQLSWCVEKELAMTCNRRPNSRTAADLITSGMLLTGDTETTT